MARRFSKEDSQAILEHRSTKTRNSPRWANKILDPVPENSAFSGLQEILNSFSVWNLCFARFSFEPHEPRSVIRLAGAFPMAEMVLAGHLPEV